LKLTVICNELPYPPTNGGRSDVWCRLKAFKENGVELQLIFWQSDLYESVSAEQTEVMNSVVSDLIICPITFDLPTLFRRLWHLRKYSSQVASRILLKELLELVIVRVTNFRPDAIWLDNIYGGVLAQELSTKLRKPLFIRSHNIEHYYFKQLIAAEQNFSNKFKLFLTSLHLKNFEFKLLQESNAFYDISIDDLSFWRNQGLRNGRWLPPFVSKSVEDLHRIQNEVDIKFDVGFLGNLNTPNNVEGVRWFITKILPLLIAVVPDIKIVIGGSNPEPTIKNICIENRNITLIENPECAFTFYASVSVLINPILKGSGVKVKSVEMLFTDRPIVTTSIGAEGLPEDAKECFCIADTPQSMAENILFFLKRFELPRGNREHVRKYFHPVVMKRIIQDIESFL
jgi:glycosyltransferase involved in cell wall biosynthesis